MHFISPEGITSQIKIIITSYGIRLMLVQLYKFQREKSIIFITSMSVLWTRKMFGAKKKEKVEKKKIQTSW